MRQTNLLKSDPSIEVNRLHNEILNHLQESLQKAIRIGEILTDQKASLRHGEFSKWLEDNIPFTDRTARNYMKLYRHRNRLKRKSVSDLTSAYLLLRQPTEQPKQITKKSDADWWSSVTADELRGIIDTYNDDLGDPELLMDREGKFVFDICDDGTMNPAIDECMVIALKFEIVKHRCEAFNTAWHLGMAALSEAWRRVLVADNEVPTSEPHRICGDNCWILKISRGKNG